MAAFLPWLDMSFDVNPQDHLAQLVESLLVWSNLTARCCYVCHLLHYLFTCITNTFIDTMYGCISCIWLAKL